MPPVGTLCGLALLGLVLSTTCVRAQTPAALPVAASDHSAQADPALAKPDARSIGDSAKTPPGWGRRADTATLGQLSGGSDSGQQIILNGSLSDTHSDNVVTGSNAISSGSFGGATGFPMVIQNTGNGVLIQNATIISVKLQP